MIRLTLACGLLVATAAWVALHRASAAGDQKKPSDEGFVSIFDGKSLTSVPTAACSCAAPRMARRTRP